MVKDNIRQELRRFAETTGIKGVSRIVKTSSKVIRLFWIFSILVCFGILIFQLYNVLFNYTSHTVTRSSKVVQTKPKFPDVTICNLFPTYNINSTRYNQYLQTIDTLKKYDLHLQVIKESRLWTYMKSIEFYNANSPLSDVFSESLDGFVVMCSQYGWDLYLPAPCKTKMIVTAPLQRCHKLELDWTNGSIAAVTALLFTNNFQSQIINGYNPWIRISTGTGASVMIHPQGTYPNPNANIKVSTGNQLTIQLKQTNVSRLQQPYGNCTYRKLLIPSQPDSPIYSTMAWFSRCRQRQMIEKCKCLDKNEIYTDEEFDPANRTFCANITQTIHETPLLQDAVIRRLEMIRCQAGYSANEDACDCTTPCFETFYETSASSSQWPNPLYHLSFYKQFIQENDLYGNKFSAYEEILKNIGNQTDEETVNQIKSLRLIEDNFLEVLIMFSDETIEELTDSAAITWDTLVANLGGSFNLWLGICVPTVAEIIELIYSLLVMVCCKRESGVIELVRDRKP